MSRRRQTAGLLILAATGAALRVVLAARSPTPYGYVFDFYHEAVQKLYALGRLPSAADCWQCYHPPLHPLLALPFYAFGKRIAGGPGGLEDPALRFVAILPLICGAVTAYYSYRILRFYRFRGSELVAGTGLALAFPCLFISSYGIEADILLTAIMTAFIFYALRFFTQRGELAIVPILRLGGLAGLACATKYTGLLAPAILIVLAAGRLPRTANRLALVRTTAAALVICAAIGGWKYVDNVKHYGTPLFANGSAQAGFSVASRPSYWRSYDFTSLRIRDLVRLAHGRVRTAQLTHLPFYRSVWTTMHGMAWGDMGLFSDPGRHGFYRQPYPKKNINPLLASAVLILGLVPTGLAAAGLVVTARRRLLLPLLVTTAVTWIVYVAWFVAQDEWALKTKYILFLLPAYVVYALVGLRWIRRHSRLTARIVFALLVALVAAAHFYLLDFAWR
jgi:hypothetical protein